MVFLWTVEEVISHGECRRMHERCVQWNVKVNKLVEEEAKKPPVRKYWFSN